MNNNPNNLLPGQSYWFKYNHGNNNKWNIGKCTRITDFGHPWVEFENTAGVITPGQWLIKNIEPQELNLKELAKEFLKNINLSEITITDMLCEFHNFVSLK